MRRIGPNRRQRPAVLMENGTLSQTGVQPYLAELHLAEKYALHRRMPARHVYFGGGHQRLLHA
jgi:hypothetical protein